MISRTFLPPCGVALLLLAASAHADGPGAYAPPPKDLPAVMSAQNAIDAYNGGYALIQRAEHEDDLAAASTKQRDRDAARSDARDAYLSALKKFEEAVRLDASMHEAFTYIGYANRKLGRYEEALKAYEQALHINPDYPHAIEYQGEAFLGLNRVAEARFNYLRLYALSAGQANKLLRAMQSWVDANRDHPPAGVDIAELSAWIADRRASSGAQATSGESW